MKISEVLWEAANHHLRDHTGYAPDADNSPYSCDAIGMVTNGSSFDRMCAREFIYGLGVGGGFREFYEFELDIDAPAVDRMTEESQGARYAWLMFASMYAEELGL